MPRGNGYVRCRGADAPHARPGPRPGAERESHHQGRRDGGAALRLCETPDMGRPAAAGVGDRAGQPQLHRAADVQGLLAGQRPLYDAQRGRGCFGAALRAAGLPHDEDERQADGHGRRSGAFVAHHADGRSQKGLLQHPARRAVARRAPRVAGHRPAYGRRHVRAI